jgi:ADP-heptose:LPS heptosyltransferase
MRILFVTSNRIGDAVLSTGLLGHLLEHHPAARFTVACGPAATGVFAAMPRLERLIAMPKRRFALHWLALWGTAVGTVWDLVVDLRASALAWLVPARQRRIFRAGDDHRVTELARLFGLDPPPPPQVWTAEPHRRHAAELLPDGRWLALGPTANWGGKQWPIERFVDLARRLTASGAPLAGARIAVFGGPGEQAAVAALLAATPAVDLVGRVDLATAAACLARATLYVGNDSGLMHIAAASGAPTLGLFGPSREAHYAPWGPHAATVRTDLSYEAILATPGYDYRSHASHMGSLGVDKVERAARALLGRLTIAA